MKNLVILVAIMVVAFSGCKSESTKRQDLLSQFAENKETYGILLSGYAEFEGDTVFFDLIPAVSFEISEEEKDIITVKTKGSEFLFAREMASDWNIPEPIEGGGKFMTFWEGTENIEMFKVFQKVVKSGVCHYYHMDDPVRHLNTTYGLEEIRAREIAEIIKNPLFEPLEEE